MQWALPLSWAMGHEVGGGWLLGSRRWRCNYQVTICNQLQKERPRDPVNWAQKQREGGKEQWEWECSCDEDLTGTGDPNLKITANE